ncbi:hypothetical protein D9613_011968 [Agrocybe pediades]|uniref:Ribonuclease H1 N-terminal domain-containing protein n=1 Tax=Agrocybe pediades TaxID=84607 RepID=A0A8H4QEM6_9AGAR|nr:hypothetical protein D9613_011968 [Agrocybe pediades]
MLTDTNFSPGLDDEPLVPVYVPRSRVEAVHQFMHSIGLPVYVATRALSTSSSLNNTRTPPPSPTPPVLNIGQNPTPRRSHSSPKKTIYIESDSEDDAYSENATINSSDLTSFSASISSLAVTDSTRNSPPGSVFSTPGRGHQRTPTPARHPVMHTPRNQTAVIRAVASNPSPSPAHRQTVTTSSRIRIPRPASNRNMSSAPNLSERHPYYAVTVGKMIGIFWDDWEVVRVLVDYVHNGHSKQFKSYGKAKEWYLAEKAAGRTSVEREPNDDIIFGPISLAERV